MYVIAKTALRDGSCKDEATRITSQELFTLDRDLCYIVHYESTTIKLSLIHVFE